MPLIVFTSDMMFTVLHSFMYIIKLTLDFNSLYMYDTIILNLNNFFILRRFNYEDSSYFIKLYR